MNNCLLDRPPQPLHSIINGRPGEHSASGAEAKTPSHIGVHQPLASAGLSQSQLSLERVTERAGFP